MRKSKKSILLFSSLLLTLGTSGITSQAASVAHASTTVAKADAVGDIIGSLGNIIDPGKLIEAIVNAISGPIQDILKEVTKPIMDAANGVAGAVVNGANGVAGGVTTGATGIGNSVSTAANGIGDGIASVATGWSNEIRSIGETPYLIKKAIGDAVKQVASDSWHNINGGISQTGQNTINDAQKLVEEAIKLTSNGATSAMQSGLTFFDTTLKNLANLQSSPEAKELATAIIKNLEREVSPAQQNSTNSTVNSNVSQPTAQTPNSSVTTVNNYYYQRKSNSKKYIYKGYYTKKFKTVRVKIKRLNGYSNYRLTKKVRSYRKNQVIKIKRVKSYYNKFRFQTSKGDWITSWAKFVTY
ncbi:hypothetical protein GPK34_00145 [Secundilactobacillus kimchicus]|nr:DUF5776 domain-containing protein [Secundilactobacillus kimchicus]MBT9670446.1 hypothetical protein [Secundilactobacillus kimchicus]